MPRRENPTNWGSEFGPAKDFISGFKFRSSVAPKENQPVFGSLLNLIDTVREIDHEFIAGLPPHISKNYRSRGVYMGYSTYGRERHLELESPAVLRKILQDRERIIFSTTRNGWTSQDIGPMLIGFQTHTGERHITVSTTSDAASRFNNYLIPGENSVDIHETGLIVGLSGNELDSDQLKSLVSIFNYCKGSAIYKYDERKSVDDNESLSGHRSEIVESYRMEEDSD